MGVLREEKEGSLVENWQKRVSTRRHLYRETIPLFLCACSLLLLSAPIFFLSSSTLCACVLIRYVFFSVQGGMYHVGFVYFTCFHVYGKHGKLEKEQKIETPGYICLSMSLSINQSINQNTTTSLPSQEKSCNLLIISFTLTYITPSSSFFVLIPFSLQNFTFLASCNLKQIQNEILEEEQEGVIIDHIYPPAGSFAIAVFVVLFMID